MMRIVSAGPVDHRPVVQSRSHHCHFYHYIFFVVVVAVDDDDSMGRAGERRGPNG